MGQNTSSRTLACTISEGHNGDGIEHKFKDIWIWNKQNTSYRTYLQVKDIWIFNQQFIMQCLFYIVSHFHCQRSWDSFPTDHGGGTTRQLLQTVPSSQRSWDCFLPLARAGGTNRLSQRTTCSTAVESPTECQLKKTTSTTWEQDQMQENSIQIWTLNIMNISCEHFCNDWNITKQAS